MKKILLFLLLSISLFAHPHTFIDIYITINKNNPNIINFKWKLDEMTSSMLLMDLDDPNKINTQENQYIKDEYFNIYAPYSYYTFIFIKGQKHNLPTPTDFKASVENHKLCFSFNVQIKQKLQDIYLEFGDADNYNALTLKSEFINAKDIKTKITGVDNDFYYGYRLEFK